MSARPARAQRRLALVTVLLLAGARAPAAAPPSYLERLPEQEIIYFLLPDRFAKSEPDAGPSACTGGRLVSGCDPTHPKFYHGGSLRGVSAKLDYIQGLGATALWLAPVFVNRAVLGAPGHESAGYHGYWITDFLHVDPHFGTNADLAALVSAAHARGMKVYLDIVINHTADVIRYRECPVAPCPYRSEAEFPYTRRGGVAGAPINDGFLGLEVQTEENFARLTRPDYAYTPYVPAGDEHRKVPDWLNDPIYYHNRGSTSYAEGESMLLGDFYGLDDLMTEHPRVRRGMIEIFGQWIEQLRIDGFRIDTVKFVEPEFWRAFVPAMQARAAAVGIRHFHMFGEAETGAADTALLARHVREDGMPVIDFAFAAAVRHTVAADAGTAELARVLADDALYTGGAATTRELATFVSNHDAGRFAYFVRRARPQVSAAEQLERVLLAHALLLTMRGVPALYYGDEQGFVGEDGDSGARQDMFATQVGQYAREARLGSAPADAGDHYDTAHPLYRAIGELTRLRRAHPALMSGAQRTRAAGDAPGLFAVSRFDPADGHEILLAFNTSVQRIEALVRVEAHSAHFRALHGECAADSAAPGSYRVRIPPLGFLACEAGAGP